MERTLLAFLFYFQSFRNGRLFSYPKSKGERENSSFEELCKTNFHKNHDILICQNLLMQAIS